MLKSEIGAIRSNQIITTESDVRFLVFENIMGNNKAKFSEVFYDSGRVIYKRRELAYIENKKITSNLTMGVCEGKVYFAHDYRVDRNCYFGYIMDIPKESSEIMCRTVVYNRSNVELQTRVISNIENVEEVKDVKDTYIITAGEKTYVVKHLRIKNVVLAIADYGIIPRVGKKCSISKLELTERQPFEMYKLTSKLTSVKEYDDVYVCETEKTRYIILKDRKNDIFGVCNNEPCIDQKMKCRGVEFNGTNPYLTQIITGVISSVKRVGHIFIVKTHSNTYYMESLVA